MKVVKGYSGDSARLLGATEQIAVSYKCTYYPSRSSLSPLIWLELGYTSQHYSAEAPSMGRQSGIFPPFSGWYWVYGYIGTRVVPFFHSSIYWSPDKS